MVLTHSLGHLKGTCLRKSGLESFFSPLFFSGTDRHTKKEVGVPELVCQKREFAARLSSSEVSSCEV